MRSSALVSDELYPIFSVHCMPIASHTSLLELPPPPPPTSFPAVPGQVENLVCPDSPDGGVLNIRWQQPSSNADSVNSYIVEVQEVVHSPPGSRMLGLRTLFQQVQPGGALMTAVTSGVSEWVHAWMWSCFKLTGPYVHSLFLCRDANSI